MVLDADERRPQGFLLLGVLLEGFVGRVLVLGEILLRVVVLAAGAPFSADVSEEVPGIRAEIPGVSSELAVLKDVLVLLVADLVEVVHVELADEGGEVAVPEVGGQDLLLEALNIKDGEVGALLVPGDNAGVLIGLNGKGVTSRIS